MAAFNKFNVFVENVAEKTHDLGSDTLRIMLVNSPAPASTNAFKTDLTEISAGFGYSAGGAALTITSSAQTSGTYKLVGNDLSFTASGGSIGPFRYAVLYNDTSTLKSLIGWWDYTTNLTLTSGNTFTVDLDQAGGILTIT